MVRAGTAGAVSIQSQVSLTCRDGIYWTQRLTHSDLGLGAPLASGSGPLSTLYRLPFPEDAQLGVSDGLCQGGDRHNFPNRTFADHRLAGEVETQPSTLCEMKRTHVVPFPVPGRQAGFFFGLNSQEKRLF